MIKTWTNNKNKKMKIEDMSDRHILNAILFVEKWKKKGVEVASAEEYRWLRQEAKERGLMDDE